jgi:glucose-1-phosphate cytidylyltransferase
MSSSDPARVPVVIFCGGRGTRFHEQTESRPKPMIEIGGRPLLWHLMGWFAGHGFADFVLCLGYKSEVIKRWFLDYAALTSDFTVELGAPGRVRYHGLARSDWRVTCVDTGVDAMTGARLKRVEQHLQCDDFLLTYGDGLADVDLPALLAFHRRHGRIATVTGVRPQSRFGELVVDGDEVRVFAEKPAVAGGWVNGGFFACRRAILDYVRDDGACVFEREALERLAREGQLRVRPHDGFWQCMDTYRDLLRLEDAWSTGRAPWRRTIE